MPQFPPQLRQAMGEVERAWRYAHALRERGYNALRERGYNALRERGYN